MNSLFVSLQHFLAELKRRHVFRVALVYLLVGWIAMQVASVTFPALHLPAWTLTLVVVLVLAGLPVALLLAWAFEITPEGVHRTQDTTAGMPRLRRSGRTVTFVVLVGLVGLSAFYLAPHDEAVANRVVVLPFENRTGDAALDPIGQMTEDGITQHLARTGLVDLLAGPDPVEPRPGDTASGVVEESGVEQARNTDAGIIVTGAYYLDDNRLLFQARVTDVATGRIISAIDPASSTRTAPREAIGLLGQRIAGVMAVLFDPRLDGGPERPTIPSPRFAAYTELRKGLDRLYTSDFDGATRRFRQAAEVDTAFLQPTLVRGITDVLLRRYAAADSVRRGLLARPDRLTPLELVQADALDGLLGGDWAGFMEAWQAGPDLVPSLNTFLRAWAALNSDRPAEAVELLEPLHPDRGGLMGEFRPYWDVLATALHATGRHRRELEEARRAAEHLPASPLTLFLETRALVALDQPERALEELRDAPEGLAGTTPWRLAPLPDLGTAMLATARELRAHGYDDDARTALGLAERWFANRPVDPAPSRADRVARAEVALATGRLDEADTVLARLAPLHADSVDDLAAFRLLGELAARRGDTAAAARVLDRLAADTPDVMGSRTFARARITRLLGRRDDALALADSARSLGYPVGLAVHLDPILEELLEADETTPEP